METGKTTLKGITEKVSKSNTEETSNIDQKNFNPYKDLDSSLNET